ncbi:MAG TPA: class I SAM-dependent methyltransferase [Pirellulales bacterium]|nr:class I SAM-dependent methyltransferase [Pirellulales bacterium]
MKRLNDGELERSWTVANSAMNRDRGLRGPSSDEKELGFSPLEVLHPRLDAGREAAWLDLACGNGRALREAAEGLNEGSSARPILVGVDLVATWPYLPPELRLVSYHAASLHQWRPDRTFDLVTCVHGLHYVGDKLGLIERSVGWLSAEGRLAAHLDLANLRFDDGRPMNRAVLARFRDLCLTYDRRRRLLMADGPRPIDFGWQHLGADDEAGPNATGQRSVNSYYGRA